MLGADERLERRVGPRGEHPLERRLADAQLRREERHRLFLLVGAALLVVVHAAELRQVAAHLALAPAVDARRLQLQVARERERLGARLLLVARRHELWR